MATLSATFEIQLTPGDPLLEGTGRFDFTKTWRGDLVGTSIGTMLSGGDPASGNAGYVALEVFTGLVDGRRGTLALQQFGSMVDGGDDLRYEVVPGSGTDELVGVSGVVQLDVVDGNHLVTLDLVGLQPKA